MMDKPQTIQDRQGRDVLLSPERWRPIVSGHPEIGTPIRVALPRPAMRALRKPESARIRVTVTMRMRPAKRRRGRSRSGYDAECSGSALPLTQSGTVCIMGA